MSIIVSFKKKGVHGIIHAILTRLFSPVNALLFKGFKCIVHIDDRLIIFESEGDLSDNSYALYAYLVEKGYKNKYQFAWLVDDVWTSRQKVSDDILLIQKKPIFIDFRRSYYLAKCKYYIYDHYNVFTECSKRNGQRIINLFHGCSFKGSKGAASNTDMEDILLVTGDFWKQIMADFVGCSVEKTEALGFPRNDYLFVKENEKLHNWITEKGLSSFNFVFLWMPTFRASTTLRISENYYKGQTGLPIMESVDDLELLNENLRNLNAIVIFKVHHLQLEYEAFNNSYTNILILKDSDINDSNLQLYQVVSLADALITDYSSIYNDYILLDRPMIFTLDDYEEYRSSRGFSIDNPADYLPGHHVYNKEQLLSAISDVTLGKDPYQHERREMVHVFHNYPDGNSSERVIERIGL